MIIGGDTLKATGEFQFALRFHFTQTLPFR